MGALLLECQVAVQDFTSALKLLITEKFELVIIKYLNRIIYIISIQVPFSIYPVIIDSFEEYWYVLISHQTKISICYILNCRNYAIYLTVETIKDRLRPYYIFNNVLLLQALQRKS